MRCLRRVTDARQLHHRVVDVGEHHRIVRPPGLCCSGRAHDERDLDERLEDTELMVEESVVTEILTVVGGHDDHGVVVETVLPKLSEKLAEVAVTR